MGAEGVGGWSGRVGSSSGWYAEGQGTATVGSRSGFGPRGFFGCATHQTLACSHPSGSTSGGVHGSTRSKRRSDARGSMAHATSVYAAIVSTTPRPCRSPNEARGGAARARATGGTPSPRDPTKATRRATAMPRTAMAAAAMPAAARPRAAIPAAALARQRRRGATVVWRRVRPRS